MNYFVQKLKLPNDLIQIERNEYVFQVSKNPFSTFRYKGKQKSQVVAHKYFLGMHMISGHGNMNGLEKIRVGEKVVWEESDVLKDNHTIIVTAHMLSGTAYLAQTFTTISSYTLSGVEFMCWRNWNAYPGTCYVTLRATDGSGFPTGLDLARGTFDGDAVIEQPASLSLAEWTECLFDAPTILENNTKYALVVTVFPFLTEGFGGLNFNADNNDNNYSGGTLCASLDGGVTWSQQPNENDILFKCYTKDGSAPNQTISIDNENIFGGDKKEGGIKGDVDLMFGDITQAQNDYLVARLDDDIPAYRGLFSAVLNQVYIGTSPYLKPWSFFLKRVCKQISGDDQWYKEKAVIRPREDAGDDLNATHIIRECLIDSVWGLGWSTDDINDNSFKETANILYDEGFGLSMLWDQVVSVENFIDEILNYIAGFLYQDLETGKWVLSLTRDPGYADPYDYYNIDDNNQSYSFDSGTRFAQTFTTSRNYTCNKVKIKVYKAAGAETANIRVELQGVNTNGDPDGNVLVCGAVSDINLSESAEWESCIFTSNIDLIVNTQYALVIYPIGTKGIYWRMNTCSSFSGGYYKYSGDGGSTWTTTLANDFMFEIYAGGGLETFDEDDIIEMEEFTRPSYGEIVDQVVVNWWDKLAHKSRPAEARDNALIEKQGNIVIEKILNYQGICNATLANRVAERELKLTTSMLAGMRLKCTRRMSHLKPNDTFILSWDKLGVTQMVVRVLNANYGNLHKNEVSLHCVEDEFSAIETIYGDAPATLWTDPINDPIDVVCRRIVEIPYRILCKELFGSPSLVDALNSAAGYICTIAEKPTTDAFDYDLLARLSAAFSFEDVGVGQNAFTPTGVLTDDLAMNATDIIIDLSSETDLDLVADDTYAIINDEIVKVLSTNTSLNQVTIARGILDTVPAAHSSGDRIYFMELKYGLTGYEYTDGDTPRVKLLTRTANGNLAEGDATEEIADALGSRMIRPYPPGNLKFNGDSYPWSISSGANGNKIAITWNHRDRTDSTQINSLVEHSDSGIGLESGASYTIKIYDEDNNLVRTVTGLTGTSYDYTEAFEISDCGSLQKQLRFVIYTVRAGFNSWQDGYDIALQRFGGASDATSGSSGLLKVSTSFGGSAAGVSAVTGDSQHFIKGP